MKWPWTARIVEAKRRAEEAQGRLDRVRNQWPAVRVVVGESRENGARFSEDHLLRLFQEGRRGGS